MARRITVIGLTGGIGMGKSTVAAQLAMFGIRTCDADKIVHRLLAKGGAAVEKVAALFPEVIVAGAVDRRALGRIVFADAQKRRALEGVLHPLVVKEEMQFVRRARLNGARMVALDIPLLFETGAEQRCDRVIVASAPAFIQRQRVLRRVGMTEEKFQHILAAQWPDGQKRGRADLVVDTGLGKAHSFRQLAAFIGGLYA